MTPHHPNLSDLIRDSAHRFARRTLARQNQEDPAMSVDTATRPTTNDTPQPAIAEVRVEDSDYSSVRLYTPTGTEIDSHALLHPDDPTGTHNPLYDADAYLLTVGYVRDSKWYSLPGVYGWTASIVPVTG